MICIHAILRHILDACVSLRARQFRRRAHISPPGQFTPRSVHPPVNSPLSQSISAVISPLSQSNNFSAQRITKAAQPITFCGQFTPQPIKAFSSITNNRRSLFIKMLIIIQEINLATSYNNHYSKLTTLKLTGSSRTCSWDGKEASAVTHRSETNTRRCRNQLATGS